MIIRELKELFEHKPEATLTELAVELGCERPMVVAAVDYWRRRGRIEIVRADGNGEQEPADASTQEVPPAGACAGSCGGCALTPFCSSPAVHYRWVWP
ncbi:hypothetical protein [Salinispira pacifica]